MINARLPFLVDFLIYTLIFTMLCFLFFFWLTLFYFYFLFSLSFFFFLRLWTIRYRFETGEKRTNPRNGYLLDL